MRNDQYFRHDASASANPKLVILLLKEGARGYGVYWMLLEMLRKQAGFRLPFDYLGAAARMCHTHRKVLERVVLEYNLFILDGEYFYSPGMDKRMSRFSAKIFKSAPEATPDSEANCLKNSESPILSARVEEKRREEESTLSFGEVSERVSPVLSFDDAVAGLHQAQVWREEMAMKSGQSRLFVLHFDWLVEAFVRFLRLRGEEGTVLTVNDAKRRFYYWMIGKEGGECFEYLKKSKKTHPTDPYRYETIVDGKRTYLGRVIPAEAPPRPNNYMVWDEEARRWTR